MFKHLNKILLRTPLQSLSLAYDFEKRNVNKLFEDGLYISSPEFYNEYIKNKENHDLQKTDKLELSFAKYWLRSSSRCTPFGTFAGATLLPIQKSEELTQNNIFLDDTSIYKRHIRLDMNYIADFINMLLQSPIVRNQIHFFPNNSIYQIEDKIRYVEYYNENNVRKYQISSVFNSDYLQNLLNIAKSGASLHELTEFLIETEKVTKTEADAFINDLCNSQILIASIEPTVTGLEPLEQIIIQLKGIVECESIINKLIEIQNLLKLQIIGIDYYQKIEQKLKELAPNLIAPKNTIQVDMYLSTNNSLINENLINSILDQVEDLKLLSFTNLNPDLENFKKEFYKKYEDREIPLSLALDSESGIGYAGKTQEDAGSGEFIDNLAVVLGGNNSFKIEQNHLNRLSLAKYEEWHNLNLDKIEIKEDELKDFENLSKNMNFSYSWYLMGSLLSKDGKLDHNNFTFNISTLGGTSGGNLLGRFAHGDEKINKFVKEILLKEEENDPDAIFAEIAHLPQARIGNILLRPVIRNYEIPYVGLSGINENNQIKTNDLYISVRNGEIILRSKRLNKRVKPRLTTAHNFSHNSLPIYKFLCDLQSQNEAYAGVWDWGSLRGLKHLPRVVYKNLILHKATWKIVEKDFAKLPKDKDNWEDFFSTFLKANKIPKRVVIKQGDNDLLIDFEERIGLELFIEYLKKYKQIQIEEFLFTNDNCFIRDQNNAPFTNEIIIPFLNVDSENKKNPINKNKISKDDIYKTDIVRTFFPGSEWLYFKIYSGAKSIDSILATTIHSFIEDAIHNNLFENFFFIRYFDESGLHFRIRFYNSNVKKNTELYFEFMQVFQPHLNNGIVESVLLDTYKRELERYHYNLINDSELLFHNDSRCVLNFLSLMNGIDAEEYRFLFGIRGIDMLLSDFGLNLEEKHSFIKQLQEGFFQEFGGQDVLKKQLNDRFRKYRKFIESHMEPANDIENEIEEAVEIFRVRSINNASVINKILVQLEQTDNPKDILTDLLSSYIHMYMNRLFIAKQRKYELVSYHFLERFYHSKKGRLKGKILDKTNS